METSQRKCIIFCLVSGFVIVIILQIISIVVSARCSNHHHFEESHGPSAHPSKSSNTAQITDSYPTDQVKVKRDRFGTLSNGAAIDKYILSNENGLTVEILTYGAIIQSIKVPDRSGVAADITLGFDTLEELELYNSPYFGALVGRVANRISNASFQLDGVNYYLNANNGQHHLHGGNKGWDKVVWTGRQIDGGVTLSHVSPHFDEGYPGEVHINATYAITDDNELIMRMTATTRQKSTPINPTSHPYFNLASEGSPDLSEHQITIFADYYLPTDSDLIVTGEKKAVKGTPYDLTSMKDLKSTIDTFSHRPYATYGFDNTFCLRGPDGKKLAARVKHAGSGRVMDIYTNQPGIQFYTSNTLNMTRPGKNGHMYARHSAFCLEAQNYPDAINQPGFPDSVLHEGSLFDHWTWFKFYTE